MLWPGCGLRQAARWGLGEEMGGPAFPGSCGVLPPGLNRPSVPSPWSQMSLLHINSQFIVGFHCIWPQRSVQGGFAARGGSTGPAGSAGRKHREGSASFKTAPKPPPPFSDETKVEISGTFPGTVFVLLRTK